MILVKSCLCKDFVRKSLLVYNTYFIMLHLVSHREISDVKMTTSFGTGSYPIPLQLDNTYVILFNNIIIPKIV